VIVVLPFTVVVPILLLLQELRVHLLLLLQLLIGRGFETLHGTPLVGLDLHGPCLLNLLFLNATVLLR
jgi:hypothetical protein